MTREELKSYILNTYDIDSDSPWVRDPESEVFRILSSPSLLLVRNRPCYPTLRKKRSKILTHGLLVLIPKHVCYFQYAIRLRAKFNDFFTPRVFLFWWSNWWIRIPIWGNFAINWWNSSLDWRNLPTFIFHG